MSSAVHVVGIKGVVLSLEGGKENGDGYKSDFSLTGKSQVCRARMKPCEREGASHDGTVSRTWKTPVLVSLSPTSTKKKKKKKRLTGDHGTICREETM